MRVPSLYKAAHGTDAVAALVRKELDAEELTKFVTAAVSDLDPGSLDALVSQLNALRSRRRCGPGHGSAFGLGGPSLASTWKDGV